MVVVWGSLKVWRHTIEGLPDPTEVFQSQQTLVGGRLVFFLKLATTLNMIYSISLCHIIV